MRGHLPLLLLSCLATAVGAEEPFRFSVSGFGSLGAVRTDNERLAFRSSTIQDSGAGRHFDPSVDSVLGVQGSAQLGAQFDLTLQALSRKASGSGDAFTPQLAWGFLRYQASPALSLRAGRTRTPFFMFSDALNVNYITPWVRPPVEVYSLNPFSALDGVDALYRLATGPLDVELQVFYGNSRLSKRGSEGRLHQARGIKVAASRPGFSLHAGHTRATVDAHWGDPASRSLIDGLLASPYADVAAELSGSGTQASFSSIGFQLEKHDWLLIGEYARRQVERFTPSAHGWYLSAGYRFGRLTPYLTYARQLESAPASKAALPGSGPYAPLAAGLALFNAASRHAQRSESIGLRWDMARSIAVKGQLERVHPEPGGLGVFLGPPPAYLERTAAIHVFSVALDFVF